MNQFHVRATPVGRTPLRYTPAGVPVAEAGLRFAGQVHEAGAPRDLDFEFQAVAVGPLALALEREPLGLPLDLAGFIAPRTRRSTRLVLHITALTRTSDT